MTKLTILLPVYNGMPYLKGAEENILDQTFTDFEFLIINDGSTDGTKEYLDSLMNSREYIITVRS